MKAITKERVNKAISAVVQSPNKSVQRAALWVRLHKIKEHII